jgi:FAD/FMN-containing dehydrogenase
MASVNTFAAQLGENHFQGKVLLPSDAEYTHYLYRWNERSRLTPRCIVVPLDAASVAVAINAASSSKLELVVQCGGHHTSKQASTETGVMVHMGALQSVTVDEQAETITFGGGCLWSHVYEALLGTKWEVVGGGVHNVGVGGHLTGGGKWSSQDRMLIEPSS